MGIKSNEVRGGRTDIASRALVLSGGGPIGVGWHAGMTTAFREAGVDVAAADLIIGTSAGAIVGSQLAAGRKPLDEIGRTVDVEPDSSYTAAVPANMQRLVALMTSSAELSEVDRLKALGAFALDAETASEDTYVERFAHLGTDAWPARFVCTGVDAVDGTFTSWDATSDVDPVRAIAASCAVPGFFPPVTIDRRRYIDGGMRSMTNADLAKGYERVLILTLFEPPAGSTDPRAQRFRRRLDDELDAISEAGGSIELLAPDAATQGIIGGNLMDPSRVSAAADAGFTQGSQAVDRVGEFFR